MYGRADWSQRTHAEVLRELAYDLASQVGWKCLRIFPRVLGSDTTTRCSMVPVQAELVQERGRRCREAVLDEPPAIAVGKAGVMALSGRVQAEPP
jgi:hypothetical protein